MTDLPSPDLPAYICYVLVLLFGMWVGAAYINRLLDSSPGRWGFFSTWLLFLAHIPVPLILFWFLDYTNALRDTSLFAALVVAIAYRQIFAGGVQGIIMAGQTPALWKPFEAWVIRVRDRITSRTILWRDRFNEKLRDYLSDDPQRLSELRALAFKYSKDTAKLEQRLKDVAARAQPAGVTPEAWKRIQAGEEAHALLQELRASFPDYAWFLKKQNIITWWQYNLWLGNQRAQWTSWAVALILLTLVVMGTGCFLRSERLQTLYHHWRFAKVNATERDRFRTHEFLRARITGVTNETLLRALLETPLRNLRYKDVPPRLAKEAIQLVMVSHSRPVNGVIVPQLIEAVRAENATVRLSVHDALKHIQRTDYPNVALSTNLLNWKAEQDAPPSEIDDRVRAWNAWWVEARQSQ